MSRRHTRSGDGPLLAWGDALRAEKQARRQLRRRVAAVAIGAGILLGSAALPPTPRLVWNASASAPIGLYAVSLGAVIDPGDMVIARVPVPYRRMAAVRRYLPMNVPLVKHVAAVAGDDVCAFGQDIFVNGRWVAERRTADAADRPMPMWTGCTRLRGRQLFLLMDAAASFDGRYFGVTEGADVLGRARLLWAR